MDLAQGITPAHAGNTRSQRVTRTSGKDHPRACGEYACCFHGKREDIGSPPRMRGIRTLYQKNAFPQGITPAHAGNTMPFVQSQYAGRDHPRACGEYSFSMVYGVRLHGSPPRMRGIPYAIPTLFSDSGITPAHAGNTIAAVKLVITRRDHPRACGEYSRKTRPRRTR